ncbi:MAG: hypothetical protein Q9183_005231, partial [Haloplaca sp. 2 TL-2023]
MALSPAGPSMKMQSPTHNVIRSRPWGEDHHYWTIDLEGRRLIVKYLHTYKTWLGPNRGFDHKTLVNPAQRNVKEPSPCSDTTSDSDDTQSKCSNATNSPGEVHRRHSTVDLTRDEETAPSSESQTTPSMSLRLYSIDTILRQDRIYYGTELPPFVASTGAPRQGVSKAELLNKRHSQRTRTYADITSRSWDLNNAYLELSVTHKGRHMAFIVKGMPFQLNNELAAKTMFFVWQGHEDGFDEKPIACPVRRLAAADQTSSKGKAIADAASVPAPSTPLQPKGRAAVDSAQLAKANDASTYGKRSEQKPVSVQGRDDLVSKITTQGFGAALTRIRLHFRHEIPPFVEPRLGIHNGKEARVILAQDDDWAEVGSVAMAKAREWNPQSIFWTLNIELKVFILGRVNVDGRSGLKRWAGVGKCLERDVYAWIIDNGPIEGFQWRPVPLSSLQQTPGATGNSTTTPGSTPRADLKPSSKAFKAPAERATATNFRKRRYVLSDEDEESEAEAVPEIMADDGQSHHRQVEAERKNEGGNHAKETDEDESEEECYKPRSTRIRIPKAVCLAGILGIVDETTDHLLIQFPRPGYQPSPGDGRGTLQSVLKDDGLSALATPSPTGQIKTNPATATPLPVAKAQNEIRAA